MPNKVGRGEGLPEMLKQVQHDNIIGKGREVLYVDARRS